MGTENGGDVNVEMTAKKFKKKPIVIEAMQFDGENGYEIIKWAHYKMHPEMNSIIRQIETIYLNHLEINTLEGTMSAFPSDWVIKGVNGEFYPCKADIFEKTYEAC